VPRSSVAITFPADALPPAAAERLAQGLAGHDVRYAPSGGWSNLDPAPAPHVRTATVVFGQPAVADLHDSSVRWVQLTSAGYGRYDVADLAGRGIALSTSSAVYAQPVAESALAMLLGAFRRLPHTLADQPDRQWNAHAHRRRTRVLRGATVALLGWGSIGQSLHPPLAALGANVRIVRRTRRGDEPAPTYVMRDLLAALDGADAVVNTLPGTEETAGLIDAEALAQLAPGAVLVNVGRGTTVDADALRQAVLHGPLGGAWLDVTHPEPLPADHPLWSTEGVWIAPHIAGGHPDEHLALVEHFLANLARWSAGEPLRDQRC